MPRRYEDSAAAVPSFPLRLGTAIRSTLRHGYTGGDLRADLMAGLVVGVVALPLSMALAIASGVAPQHGLYTAIVAGIVVRAARRLALPGHRADGGVRRHPRAHRRASSASAGCSSRALMAGVMLVVHGRGAARPAIQFIPHPVTTGFTAGIAVVIATLQLKDFLGLHRRRSCRTPTSSKVATLVGRARHRSRWELVVGAVHAGVLLVWPRIDRASAGAAGRARPRRRRWPRSLARCVPGLPRRHHRLALSLDGRRPRGGRHPAAAAAADAAVAPAGAGRHAARARRSRCSGRCCRRRSPSPCSAPSSRCSRRSSPTA